MIRIFLIFTLLAFIALTTESTLAAEATCRGLTATIVGTEGNDTLNGTSEPDVISGLGGNDTINGFDGNDVICGGPGRDTLNGGNGNDRLFGNRGNDTLNGGDGNDRLRGGGGSDTMDGGNNTDNCYGGPRDDTRSNCELKPGQGICCINAPENRCEPCFSSDDCGGGTSNCSAECTSATCFVACPAECNQ